jgi:hypothetical protein
MLHSIESGFQETNRFARALVTGFALASGARERMGTPPCGALRIEPHDPSIPSITSRSSCEQYAERTDAFCWFTMFHTQPKHDVCCQCGSDLSPVCCLLFAVQDAILVNVDVG